MCQASQAQSFVVSGKQIKLRTWGPEKNRGHVVVVHGWSGRWDQFTEMIQYMTEKGYQVSAFDFPAHGESPGLSTDAFEWAEALVAAAKLLPKKAHFICHSFGLFAVSHAYLELKLPMYSLIAINSPSKFYFIFQQFVEKVGLTSKTQSYLFQQVKKRVGPNIEDRLNVPLPRLRKSLPFHFVADQQDKEVPFTEHTELASLLKEDFFVTQKLGHNGVLRDHGVHEQIFNWVTQASPA